MNSKYFLHMTLKCHINFVILTYNILIYPCHCPPAMQYRYSPPGGSNSSNNIIHFN